MRDDEGVTQRAKMKIVSDARWNRGKVSGDGRRVDGESISKVGNTIWFDVEMKTKRFCFAE